MREADREALRGELGEGGVVEHDPVEVEGATLGVTLAPDSVEALAAGLRALDERKLSVLMRGGGSRLSLGNLPERVDALLSTERLDGILELDTDEGVVRARGGTPLAVLSESVRESGWEVPLDPSTLSAELRGPPLN